jgi:hypothetical protein
VPENRDQSRQKRSKENRASREAVQARKAAVAKKTEPVEETTKGKRKTRAQAAPVRGSGATAVTAGTTKAAGGSKAAGASKPAAPRPAPVEVDPDAPWIRRVVSVPGGRAVLISFGLAVAVTIFVLAVSGPRTVERWNSKLDGRDIVHCVDTDNKQIKLDGRSAESVCGYAPDASQKYKDSDNRTLAQVNARILEIYGPSVFALLAIPLLASGVALALAARSNRRRIFAYAALMFGLWMALLGLQFGVFYVVSFGALVFAWWQARKADPPVRPERPAGGGLFGGGGGGGLFGGGRRRSAGSDDEIIDAEIVDEGGSNGAKS